MTDKKWVFTVTLCDSSQIWKWLTSGRGLAVWRSVNLSNPGGQWLTPAFTETGEPSPRPIWEADNKPFAVYTMTDAPNIGVVFPKTVKSFHVAIRPSSQGFGMKVTDGGSRRIWKTIAKTKKELKTDEVWYVFNYGEKENVSILAADKILSFPEWNEIRPKLIYDKDGSDVCVGDTVLDRDGDEMKVTGWSVPAHPGSTGRVQVKTGDSDREFFPSVINAHWVNVKFD